MNFYPVPPFAIEALAKGNIQKANDYLGFEYALKGTVVHGNHLGRSLGFPTANLELTKDSLPLYLPHGVYAARVEVNHNQLKAMANIGIRPTVDGKKLTIETHIFDFEGDLYGMVIVLFFIERIRDERKFIDLQELVHQLEHDKNEALRLIDRLQ